MSSAFRGCVVGLVAVLGGCAVPVAPSGPGTGDAEAGGVGPRAGLPEPPPCASNATATLDDGLLISFEGSLPDRPDVCVASWQGRPHQYYLGFWGDGHAFNGTSQEREAVLGALTGPVGTQRDFPALGANLWKDVTVTHVANPILIVDGKPRPTVELREELHDAHGRPDVRAEFLHWVDQATGIALRRQTVTQTANGQTIPDTTWQVRSLEMPPS